MKTISLPKISLTSRLLTILLVLSFGAQLQAQEEYFYIFRPKKVQPCGEVMIDLVQGTINGQKPDADYASVRKALPGCTEIIDTMERRNDAEEFDANSVGFRFFFGANTVEVWKGVKAKMSNKIWGKKPKVLNALFGEAEVKGDFHRIYKTEYGSLYADLDKRGKILLISMHITSVDDTWKTLCMDSGYCR